MASEYEVDDALLGGGEEEDQQTTDPPIDGDDAPDDGGVTIQPTGPPITLRPAAAASASFFETLGPLEMAILAVAGTVGLLFLCLLLSFVYSGEGNGMVAAVPQTTGL